MKSPRWHFQRAEQLMDQTDGDDPTAATSMALTQRALVHSNLAQAAPGLIVGESLLDRGRNGTETPTTTKEYL